MTGLTPDDVADPAGFVLAACDLVEAVAGRVSAGQSPLMFDRPESNEWLVNMTLAQVALWRAVVAAEDCFGKEFRPVADAVVAAARAYLTGPQ